MFLLEVLAYFFLINPVANLAYGAIIALNVNHLTRRQNICPSIFFSHAFLRVLDSRSLESRVSSGQDEN